MLKKIGIITCSNTTQDLGCSSFKCLGDINNQAAFFERYKESGGVELHGIINCAGCPTVTAPEKLLRRVKSLTNAGLDAIHISTCMMELCPFKNKYVKLLESNFPEIDIVQGTHGGPKEEAEMFMDWVKDALENSGEVMGELMEKVDLITPA